MKKQKQKSASYDSDWLRENSEKEYGLPYEEALEMSYDNLRVAYDQLTQQKSEFFAEIERLRARIAELERDLRDAVSSTMIQNLNAEIVRLRHELLSAYERHAPECQYMQISGADKRCVDGRDRHYCERHESHEGLHRCRCGVKW